MDLYIDSINGNDSFDGMSPDRAWASFDVLNGMTVVPGTRILLRSGSAWNGSLCPAGEGTAEEPVIITSYGEGPRPLINGCGAGAAVRIKNWRHIIIEKLEISNVSPDIYGPHSGVLVVGEEKGGDYKGITLRDLYIHNITTTFKRETGGIIIWAGEADTPVTFSDLTVEGCTVCDSGSQGITFSSVYNGRIGIDWTKLPYTPSNNITIRNNYVARCAGDGIFQSCAESPVLEHNTVSECCFAGNTAYAGIWPHNSQRAVMKNNEVFGCLLIGGDGQGYDVDIDCTDTLVTENLSHHNGGGFILLCTSGNIGGYNNGITVSGNISIDDSGQIFTVSGPVRDVTIKNNRVCVTENRRTRLIGMYEWAGSGGGPDNITVENNFFYMNTDGKNQFYKDTHFVFKNNTYGGSYDYSDIPEENGEYNAEPFDKSSILKV